MPNAMLFVSNCDTVAPLSLTVVSIVVGSASVSIHGPIGLKVSVFFERHIVLSEACQVRSLTSFPTVYPSTHENASDSDKCFTCLPMTTTSSPSYCTFSVASSGMTIGSPCAISALFARYPMLGCFGTSATESPSPGSATFRWST